ncbi:hypothetical protein CcaverHIS002_0111240 [Cutaneotrichosporon cavernicola]|nr:hypothetical protein CcaverHIS002_0111240 [Cutaneotrichosporon cavernicola]
MAANPPPSGGPSANGANGAASPAPSAISQSSVTSRISFAIPSATPQKAAAKGAPVNLDTRAALPPKPMSATSFKPSTASLPARPARPSPLPWPPPTNGFGGVMRMGSASASPGAGPSTERSTERESRREERGARARSQSREPGEVSPPREKRRRSRSRDRLDDRYRRDRDRSLERDYRDHHRDRDIRDHRRERDRDRDRDWDRDRERDRGYRSDRYRASRSPERRTYDDERPSNHSRSHRSYVRDREHEREREREHERDRRDRDRYARDSRSPVKSPSRTERLRSPVKRRSPSPVNRATSSRPHNVFKPPSPPSAPPPAPPSAPPPAPPTEPLPPPHAPPPPPPDDAPPPPPDGDAPPPPPASTPPPPPPVELRLPSRPLSPQSIPSLGPSSAPSTRHLATPPSGPRALARPAYGPGVVKAANAPPAWGPSAANTHDWKPPPSAFRRPGIGNWLMVLDPADPKNYVKRVDGVINGMEVHARDPRLKIPLEVRERGAGYMKDRKDGLHPLKYEWDEQSPAVLLMSLSPLTTVEQVSKFLRPHGRIKEIDAKMDPRSGMQLGIVWVRFDGPAPGKTGTAHDVAKNVVRICDGQRVGLQSQERVRVVLDGRGLLAEKAVKEEMAKRNAPKPKLPPLPSAPTPAISTPSEGKQTPKPPTLSRPVPRPPPPRGPKFETFGRNFASLNRSLPVDRFQHQPRSGLGAQAVQDFSRDFRGPVHDRDYRRFPRGEHLSPATSGSRSRSRSPSTSDSDSDDDFRRRRADSPRRRARGPARAAVDKKEADEAAVERVRQALAANAKAYIFIEVKSLPTTQSEANVRDHFRAFKPDHVLCNHTGWYVLFGDDQSAYRAQRVLDKTAVQGHRINIDVRTHKGEAAGPAEPEKAAGGWRFLTISKNRKAAPRPSSPKKARRRLSVSYTSSDDDEPRLRKVAKKVETKELEPVLEPESEPLVEEIKVEAVDDGETKIEIEVELEPDSNKKKRAGKAVKVSKTKKARIESPPVAEVKVAAKPQKPKPRKKTVFDKLVAADLLADDEDAYWLAQALAHEGEDIELSDAESDLDEEHPLHHTSGAWRAEGYRKVAATKKSVYLPQRNRATAAASAAAMPGGTAVLATGRTARVEGRRLNIDLESTRKAASASNAEANDVFAFNQLRIRKKQLRFARSAIEGYGLYAMETIQPNEMVCEYVGELCRVAVSEVREQRYMKQGIGSSYLFRIDGDIVCDATFKGSVSRLVNHSCDPNCLAKIISINGVNKIVLYAKRTIHPGEECLYSYNFALETDPALRVPCLCGSEKCTGFLN